MNTKSEFEKAVEYLVEQELLQKAMPRNQWRAYHTDGKIHSCANGPDWPEDQTGSWVEITQDEAKNIFDYRVQDNKLVKIDKRNLNVVKLEQDPQGPYRTVPDNISLLLVPGENVPDAQTYAKNTDRSS